MSKRPLKRASYVLHIATVTGLSRRNGDSILSRLAYVRLLDEVLDLFETEPRFQHFVLDGEIRPLENYLTIRPENFERIEQLVDEGWLLIGPWYAQLDPDQSSAETAIRSLMLGLQTADIFGRPMMVGYLPHIRKLPGYLPQIFKAFEIEVAISDHVANGQPNELLWLGDDGTQIVLGQLRQGTVSNDVPIADLRAESAPDTESGHLLFLYDWNMEQSRARRLELLRAIPAAAVALHDNVFHSHPAAYAKALQSYAQTKSLPKIFSGPDEITYIPAEWALTRVLEPLMAWAEALTPLDTEQSIRRPQYFLQQLWKRYLSGEDAPRLVADCYQLAEQVLADIARHIDTTQWEDSAVVVFNPDLFSVAYQSEVVLPLGFLTSPPAPLSASNEGEQVGELVRITTGSHEGSLPLSTSLITASEPQFRITATKLPDDPDQTGLIVRGHNIGDEDLWVTLTPWQAYKVIDVVTMGEEPTGGRLAQESNGAVKFKAAPHRILTFWFHD